MAYRNVVYVAFKRKNKKIKESFINGNKKHNKF